MSSSISYWFHVVVYVNIMGLCLCCSMCFMFMWLGYFRSLVSRLDLWMKFFFLKRHHIKGCGQWALVHYTEGKD